MYKTRQQLSLEVVATNLVDAPPTPLTAPLGWRDLAFHHARTRGAAVPTASAAKAGSKDAPSPGDGTYTTPA